MIRPQPTDLAPWPLGALLILDVDGGAAMAIDAVAGRDVEPKGPLAFWAAAAADDAAGALSALAALEGPEVQYNRFVLSPNATELARLRGELTGALAELLELAAFRTGLRSDLPTFERLDGELLASAHAAAASHAVESHDLDSAARELTAAIESAREPSPGLAAQLMLSAVEIARLRGAQVDVVITQLREALTLLGDVGHATSRAELQLELGVMLQESGLTSAEDINEAASCFQAALLGLDEVRHRRAHGFAQMRLGLLYLARPMGGAGDALRLGVATQALVRAVDVFDEGLEPDLWCAAASNLANAYQVLPSGHFEENLERCLGLYDRALELRPAAGDPVGHARLLINRANAAATMGRLDEAIEGLQVACPVLQAHGHAEELDAARRLLEDLRRSWATAGGRA